MDALIVLFASGLISLFSAFTKKPLVVIAVALTGLSIAIGLLVSQYITGHNFITLEYEGLEFSKMSTLYSISSTVVTFLLIALGYQTFKNDKEHTGEYIALLMFSACGAMIMFCFTDLFMFFLGLEILSIPIYVMAGSNKNDLRSNEASLKYFILGVFATGILLFGIAWVYGATGSFSLVEIREIIASGTIQNNGILLIGILLILASFLFKIAAAPFHFWSPDVYDGAPHVVTGFMITVVKIAAFGAFLKIFMIAFGSEELHNFWAPIIAVLIVITVFIGNLSALRQSKFKRMLAYSSIAHAGYTLMVVLTLELHSVNDLWFYMTSYSCSIIVLIAIGMAVNDEEDNMESLRGLIHRNPILGVTGIIALLSLAGVPPTAGFFGKYMIFSAAASNHMWLVIIALINSGIGAVYYLKLITIIASKPRIGQAKISMSLLSTIVVGISIIGVLTLVFVIPFL